MARLFAARPISYVPIPLWRIKGYTRQATNKTRKRKKRKEKVPQIHAITLLFLSFSGGIATGAEIGNRKTNSVYVGVLPLS